MTRESERIGGRFIRSRMWRSSQVEAGRNDDFWAPEGGRRQDESKDLNRCGIILRKRTRTGFKPLLRVYLLDREYQCVRWPCRGRVPGHGPFLLAMWR